MVEQALSRSIVARSLMFRVLLPIGALLVVLVAGSVAGVALKDSAAARTALSDKAKLIADIAGRGTADAIWNLDAQLAKASLAALAVDPDYVGSTLSDDHGAAFANDGAKQTNAGALIVEKVPVVRVDQGKQTVVGALELRMSTARADAAIAEATWVLALVGAVALVVVCGLLLWILKSATRPIEALTETMAQLSSGDLAVDIPALDRADEVGRMAHAVAVFKRNAIEVERLNAEQATMEARSERERVELLDRMATEFEQTVSGVLVNVTQSCARMGERAQTMAGKMSAAEDSTLYGDASDQHHLGQCPDRGGRGRGTVGLDHRDRQPGQRQRRDRRRHLGCGRAHFWHDRRAVDPGAEDR